MKKVFLVLGGLFVTLVILLIASNWKTCSRDYYIADQNGNRLPTDTYDNLLQPNPCNGGPTCQVITTTKIPELRCLINPFPGGL